MKISVVLLEDSIYDEFSWISKVLDEYSADINFSLIFVGDMNTGQTVEDHIQGTQPLNILKIFENHIHLVRLPNLNKIADPEEKNCVRMETIEKIINLLLSGSYNLKIIDRELLPIAFRTKDRKKEWHGVAIIKEVVRREREQFGRFDDFIIFTHGEKAKKNFAVDVYDEELSLDQIIASRYIIKTEENLRLFLDQLLKNRPSYYIRILSELMSSQTYGKHCCYGFHHLTHHEASIKGCIEKAGCSSLLEFLVGPYQAGGMNFIEKSLKELDVLREWVKQNGVVNKSKNNTLQRMEYFLRAWEKYIKRGDILWNITETDLNHPATFKRYFRLGGESACTQFSVLVENAIALAKKDPEFKGNVSFIYDTAVLNKLGVFYCDVIEIQRGLKFIFLSIGKRKESGEVFLTVKNVEGRHLVFQVDFGGNFDSNTPNYPIGYAGSKLRTAKEIFKGYCEWKIITKFSDGTYEVELYSGKLKKVQNEKVTGIVRYEFHFWLPEPPLPVEIIEI